MLLTTFYTIYYSHKEYIYQVTTGLKKITDMFLIQGYVSVIFYIKLVTKIRIYNSKLCIIWITVMKFRLNLF